MSITTTNLAILILVLVVALFATTRLIGRGKPETAPRRNIRIGLTFAIIALTAIYFYMRYGPK